MKENNNRIHEHTLFFLYIKKKNHTKIKLNKKHYFIIYFSHIYLKYQYLDVCYFFQYLFD